MQKGTHSMVKSPQSQMEIQLWPVDRLVFYARNPRKNDAAVDRMCGNIREFGFKIPMLAPSAVLFRHSHDQGFDCPYRKPRTG